MIDVDCDQTPLAVGETRVLRITGDAPFTVRVGRFVSDRHPVGLQQEPESPARTIGADEPLPITADEEFWSDHQGGLQIDITDAQGSRRRLHINVRPRSKGLGHVMVRA